VATAHSSTAASTTHPAATHAAGSAHAVTATAARAAATMLLAGVGGVSARRLVGTGENPFAAEVGRCLGTGHCRHCNQQAQRKNNTHALILLFVMYLHPDSNARAREAPTAAAKSAVTKRKRMQRLWRRRDKARIAA